MVSIKGKQRSVLTFEMKLEDSSIPQRLLEEQIKVVKSMISNIMEGQRETDTCVVTT